MRTKDELFRAAQREIAARRQHAVMQAETARRAAYAANPALSAADDAKMRAGLSLARTAALGGDMDAARAALEAADKAAAEAAQAAGRFDDEIVPVMIKVKKEMVPFAKDEYPKAGVTADSIAKLKGAFPVGPESPNPVVVNTFEPTGCQDAPDKGTQRVTAANASGINDGAAAIVLASGEAVAKYGLKPMAKLIGWGQGGVDPKIMGVGPVVASRNAMKKAGVTIDDIDLIEANEAFAAQSIAVARELHFDMSKVNVNGGAIALGHPVGASGARIIVTLLHEMQKRPEAKKGLATLCIGGGMGTAVVFEKC